MGTYDNRMAVILEKGIICENRRRRKKLMLKKKLNDKPQARCLINMAWCGLVFFVQCHNKIIFKLCFDGVYQRLSLRYSGHACTPYRNCFSGHFMLSVWNWPLSSGKDVMWVFFFSFPSACSCFHGVSDETGGKPISLLKVSSCVVLGSAWLRCGRKLVSVVWRGVLCPQGISCMLQCLASWFFFVKC